MKQTALVTGASRGIGYAIASRLGHDGFSLVLMATNSPELHRNKLEQLTAQGIEWIYVQGDIRNAADRQAAVDKAVESFGGIHVLVNNAGVAPQTRTDILDMTEESFDRVISVNTKGTLFLTQAVVKQMLRQPFTGKKRGTIINISSCSAAVSSVTRGEYCVSKAGVSMLTTLFADRLASEGILVNEVRPGVIATDMTSSVTQKYNDMFASGDFPIARWGTPEDVAGAVSALASDDFLYTTGSYIDVDGGFHIRRL